MVGPSQDFVVTVMAEVDRVIGIDEDAMGQAINDSLVDKGGCIGAPRGCGA